MGMADAGRLVQFVRAVKRLSNLFANLEDYSFRWFPPQMVPR